MTLTLTQRLQLMFLLGEQEGNAGDIRSLSKIMDKIQVAPEDLDRIKFVQTPQGGAAWDARIAAEQSDVDLNAEQKVRIKKVIDKWPKFKPADAGWLSPLLDELEK